MNTTFAAALAAVLFAVAGVAIVLHIMRNFDPNRVRVRSTIFYTYMVVAAMFSAGLCLTASRLRPGATFVKVVDFGWPLATGLALIGLVICVVPAILALVQARNDFRETVSFELHLQNHHRPWKLSSTKPEQRVTPAPRAVELPLASLPTAGQSRELHRAA